VKWRSSIQASRAIVVVTAPYGFREELNYGEGGTP